jgi:hypothetical protein
MTVQLDWPPDVVDRLTEEARQKGLSLDDYVLQTVLQQKAQNGSVVSDEEAKRKAREEAGQSIRDATRTTDRADCARATFLASISPFATLLKKGAGF